MPLSSPPAGGSLPFLDHLKQDSARFRAVLADAPAEARVPSCPDWEADDLLWHLTGVQWFWGEIAERRATTGADVEALDAAQPERPSDRAGLLALFDRWSERLHRVLAETPPETELWMWADDHSAAYISRRQAHEALIHRVDAELTSGAPRESIDCRLAADGIDEVLRIMRGYDDQPGLTDTPAGPSVTISIVDGFHTWTVTPVRVTGTDSDGDEWDELRFRVQDGPGAGVAAEICGTAADLDCWLWNRPVGEPITRTGDEAALSTVDAVLAGSID